MNQLCFINCALYFRHLICSYYKDSIAALVYYFEFCVFLPKIKVKYYQIPHGKCAYSLRSKGNRVVVAIRGVAIPALAAVILLVCC